MPNNFSIEPLSPAIRQDMIEKSLWKEGCPVALERLRLLTIPYLDFEHKHSVGQMMVLDAVASHVIELFKTLYTQQFPIAHMQLMNAYDGNDEASMRDNNSSAFNHRVIAGSPLMSLHAYGVAIDINPLQNPFIEWENKPDGTATASPAAGWAYLNRTNLRPGMVEPIVDLFYQHGFTVWGGQWNTPIDWHHFQTPRALAQLLAIMSAEDATQFFDLHTQFPQFMSQINPLEQSKLLVELYQKAPARFIKLLGQSMTELNKFTPDAVLKKIAEAMTIS
jgi:hypothetical protein